MILLNPKKYDVKFPDKESQEMMLKTIEFFEKKGLKKVKDDFHDKTWPRDFVDFQKEHKIFAKLLTPAGYGAADSRWDTYRIFHWAELMGFYGIAYWYVWDVSQLGICPIWMGSNEEAKHKAAKLVEQGEVFAFGLSEKEHGADIYSSDMMLYPQGDGTYKANGDKYYIGNGNEAAMVSTFSKIADTDDYVFFCVDSKHPNYECVQNTVAHQNYVAEYAVHDYPITEADVTEKGPKAWDNMLNTVNVCKFNLGPGAVGIATHALYEAIDHAANRNLYGKYVTDFPHVKQLLTDSYLRICAMKLFNLRAVDYMRTASAEDRRYLLYDPLCKMKVTREGEEVINLLWDVIAAKGFEKEPYFEMATWEIRMFPKLEGTVHVNMALVVKFITNYFFNPAEFPAVPQVSDARNDAFLMNQGPTSGLSKIQFHDYNIAYNSIDLPNIKIIKEQIATFKEFLAKATPTKEQNKDIDYLLAMGELMTVVAYGQLIIENAKIYKVDDDIIDMIFDVLVRDFSKYAVQLYQKKSNTPQQLEYCIKMIKNPVADIAKFTRVWEKYVYSLKGEYKMND
ncbi:MAG TPA: acyl-CoA dehydrogenase family protein [Spirochaetota bacterium]|nr:acyl-CoA dehydrogenase family protein [Spirochaetota bacterium]HPS85361.1 acyl-CoA dehydrogenase family protein [Spirochaetota bacterium]